MSDKDFEDIIRETIEGLPEEFKKQLDNVEIVIADEPGTDGVQIGISKHALLLGLYRGIPKTARFSCAALPDKITLYKNPILLISKNETEARKNIRKTVLHEIGHHFGLTDEVLAQIEKK